MNKKIYCPECARKGYKPRLIGTIEEGTIGAVRFWCRSCKCEIRAEMGKGGNIKVDNV